MKSTTKSYSGERYNQSSATRTVTPASAAFATERDPLLNSSPSQPGYTSISISPDHSQSHNNNNNIHTIPSAHNTNTVRNRSRNRNKDSNSNSNSNSDTSMSSRIDGHRTPPSFAEAPSNYSEDNLGHSGIGTPYEIYNDSNVSNVGRSMSRDRVGAGAATVTATAASGAGSFGLNTNTGNSRDISRPLGSMRYLRSNRDRDGNGVGPSPSHSRVHNSNSLQSRRDRERGGDGDRLQQYYNERANRIFSDVDSSNDEPLVEVNQEIMAVRRSALTVYEPLTYTWVSAVKVCSIQYNDYEIVEC